MWLSRWGAIAAAVMALAWAGGCSSHQDQVCEDIGDCARGGDNDWIETCQSNAKALRAVAADAGCPGAFDDYYTCAESAFACHGATATFPGCDDRLAALDTCLATATQGTSCAALASAEAACGQTGAAADAGVPPACTARRDCVAACYLGRVADRCAPRTDELEAANDCAASCPP